MTTAEESVRDPTGERTGHRVDPGSSPEDTAARSEVSQDIRRPAPLVIVGPTASGKSALAMAIAERLAAEGTVVELVSGDSMQVYRGMDIGTAKPTPGELAAVPHHLVDVVDPSEEFSVAMFVESATAALEEIASRGNLAIVVGGTGMYLQLLVDRIEVPGRYPAVRDALEAEPDTAALHQRLVALDPVAAARMEPSNRRRVIRALEVTIGSGTPFSDFGPGIDAYPETDWTLVGMDLDRETLGLRIRERFSRQLDAGFLDEVAALQRGPAPLSRTAAQALGYKELARHLTGDVSLEEAVEEAIVRTRRFAIRQIRWFRRDPRIEWLTYNRDPTELVDPVVDLWLNGTDHRSVPEPTVESRNG